VTDGSQQLQQLQQRQETRQMSSNANSDRQQAQGQGRLQLNDVTPAEQQCELRNAVN